VATAVALTCALSLACGMNAFGMEGKASASAKTKGYVVTWYGRANYKGPDDCPKGEALMPDKEAFIKTAHPEEQKSLRDSQNELYKRMAERGPLGELACEHPEAIAEQPLRTVEGKTAYGVNMDGVSSGVKTPKTCAHQKFTGVDGEPNVDNQLYRVTGCMYGLRDEGMGGWITKLMVGAMRDGNYTIVFELTGVDDLRNDDHVDVGIYSADDPIVRGADGGFPKGSSIQITKDEEYHTHTTGKIVNGVLTTDPVDVHLKVNGLEAPGVGYMWRDARLKLELQPDGSAKGLLAGYLDWRWLFRAGVRGQTSSEFSAGHTCPAFYAALRDFADGRPDPETGECTAISAAYMVEAVPAFIIHDAHTASAAP
jgi:hypothetical protein